MSTTLDWIIEHLANDIFYVKEEERKLKVSKILVFLLIGTQAVLTLMAFGILFWYFYTFTIPTIVISANVESASCRVLQPSKGVEFLSSLHSENIQMSGSFLNFEECKKYLRQSNVCNLDTITPYVQVSALDAKSTAHLVDITGTGVAYGYGARYGYGAMYETEKVIKGQDATSFPRPIRSLLNEPFWDPHVYTLVNNTFNSRFLTTCRAWDATLWNLNTISRAVHDIKQSTIWNLLCIEDFLGSLTCPYIQKKDTITGKLDDYTLPYYKSISFLNMFTILDGKGWFVYGNEIVTIDFDSSPSDYTIVTSSAFVAPYDNLWKVIYNEDDGFIYFLCISEQLGVYSPGNDVYPGVYRMHPTSNSSGIEYFPVPNGDFRKFLIYDHPDCRLKDVDFYVLNSVLYGLYKGISYPERIKGGNIVGWFFKIDLLAGSFNYINLPHVVNYPFEHEDTTRVPFGYGGMYRVLWHKPFSDVFYMQGEASSYLLYNSSDSSLTVVESLIVTSYTLSYSWGICDGTITDYFVDQLSSSIDFSVYCKKRDGFYYQSPNVEYFPSDRCTALAQPDEMLNCPAAETRLKSLFETTCEKSIEKVCAASFTDNPPFSCVVEVPTSFLTALANSVSNCQIVWGALLLAVSYFIGKSKSKILKVEPLQHKVFVEE